MRFPLTREFSSSYRSMPDKHRWAESWRIATLRIRDRNRTRAGIVAAMIVTFMTSGVFSASHGGEFYSLLVSLATFVAAMALAYRHFKAIDDEVLRNEKKVQQTSPATRNPSGTSGMSPADPASRAGDMPEASGDS